MNWGHNAQWLEDVAAETGVVPSALINRIDPEDFQLFAWQAFWELHSDRPIGFGDIPAIPFSAIDRYASRYGVDNIDDFDRLRVLIRTIDAEYLKWMRSKNKQAQSGKPPG